MYMIVWCGVVASFLCHSTQNCMVPQRTASASKLKQGKCVSSNIREKMPAWDEILRKILHTVLTDHAPSDLINIVHEYYGSVRGKWIAILEPYHLSCTRKKQYIEDVDYRIWSINATGMHSVEVLCCRKSNLEHHIQRTYQRERESIEVDIREQCNVSGAWNLENTDSEWGNEQIIPGVSRRTALCTDLLLKYDMIVVPRDHYAAQVGSMDSSHYLVGWSDFDELGQAIQTYHDNIKSKAQAYPNTKFRGNIVGSIDASALDAVLNNFPRHTANIKKLIAGKGALVPVFYPQGMSLKKCVELVQARGKFEIPSSTNTEGMTDPTPEELSMHEQQTHDIMPSYGSIDYLLLNRFSSP